jgi:hypothetical protein
VPPTLEAELRPASDGKLGFRMHPMASSAAHACFRRFRRNPRDPRGCHVRLKAPIHVHMYICSGQDVRSGYNIEPQVRVPRPLPQHHHDLVLRTQRSSSLRRCHSRDPSSSILSPTVPDCDHLCYCGVPQRYVIST